MKNQIIKNAAFGLTAILVMILTAFGSVFAQAEGDMVVVTMNGSDTYEVEANDGMVKVYRHGRIKGGSVYYIDPEKGWKSISLAAVKVRTVEMPEVGEEVFVVANDKIYKATLKKIGVGGYDTASLFIKADIVDGKQTINDHQANDYATESEAEALGWKVAAAKPKTFPEVADSALRQMEQEAFDIVNEARANPAAFANKMENLYKNQMDATTKETIRFLRNMAKQKNHEFAPLEREDGLDKAAREHAADNAKNGEGHQGTSDDCSKVEYNNWVGCRMARHGTRNGMYAENIFGRGNGEVFDGAGGMMALTLDHGVSSRGHRAGFFDAAVFNATFDDATSFKGKFTKAGVGAAYDKTTGNISLVWVFSNEYETK